VVDVEVIERPAAAVIALDPVRARLLAELAAPASAAALAQRVGLTRQKVNYHLRQLEEQGLVRVAEQRRWGGITERLLVATAASYVVAPSALGAAAADPSRARDRLSARYAIALGARLVGEIGTLVRRSEETRTHPSTLAIDAEIRFAAPSDRARFAQELTEAITALAARYHDAVAPEGRVHRLVVAAHPIPEPSEPFEPQEAP
jgi:DNA-binding transcriptional ArsR family regulator